MAKKQTAGPEIKYDEALQAILQSLNQLHTKVTRTELGLASCEISIRNNAEATTSITAELKDLQRAKKKKGAKKDESSQSENEDDEGSEASNSEASTANESDEERRSKKSKFRGKGKSKDNDLAGIKMRIPEFQGKPDPEAYMEWEEKVDRIFEIHEYSERKKVKLAVVEFTGSASIWWRKTCLDLQTNMEDPISTWKSLKKHMRKKYIPSHHKCDVLKKLQGLL